MGTQLAVSMLSIPYYKKQTLTDSPSWSLCVSLQGVCQLLTDTSLSHPIQMNDEYGKELEMEGFGGGGAKRVTDKEKYEIRER